MYLSKLRSRAVHAPRPVLNCDALTETSQQQARRRLHAQVVCTLHSGPVAGPVLGKVHSSAVQPQHRLPAQGKSEYGPASPYIPHTPQQCTTSCTWRRPVRGRPQRPGKWKYQWAWPVSYRARQRTATHHKFLSGVCCAVRCADRHGAALRVRHNSIRQPCALQQRCHIWAARALAQQVACPAVGQRDRLEAV